LNPGQLRVTGSSNPKVEFDCQLIVKILFATVELITVTYLEKQ